MSGKRTDAIRAWDFAHEKPSSHELLQESVRSALEDPAVIQMMAACIVERIEQDMGGERCYIPRPSLSGRNARILLEYRNGARVSDLAKRYDLTESRIYQIIGSESETG